MVFLFTEIDHPTLFEQRGTPEADHILACQYFLIEEILATHGVHWMQRSSTGVLAVFEGGEPLDKAQGRPAEAAIAIEKNFQSHLWEKFGKAGVRVALHAGEAEAMGQSYVGPDFTHALKVLEAVPKGQVLLTVPAVHFIPLTPGSRLKDLDKHFLKDLSAPQNLYALVHPDLEAGDIQTPRSLQNYPQNFFPQESPFFGREEELSEIAGLLNNRATRLITLIGPGGFGKTRLAYQCAAEVVEKFKDGVFIVALAPLLSDQLLIGSIANAIKFFFYGAEDPQTQLLNHLREKEMLLVMDNFEHIIEGAELVGEILKAAPRVKVMATSRENLGLEDEKTFEVKGLRFPAAGQTQGLEGFSAVQLFLKSARRTQPRFSLVPEDQEPLLQICRLLEGMPLGLELSATWVGTMTLPQIAEKIESSRDFLATSMPHLPPRHRSLRAVFEYSWILLSESQKKALRSLSVFKGGFTEPAARKVAGANGELLNYLAKKSLVNRRDHHYEIHQLLKYYAKEKLFDDPPAKEKALDAHCLYFGEFLHKKEKALYGPEQKKTLEELALEIGNIREGWKRAVEKGMVKELEDYSGAFFSILETKGWFLEAREAFQSAVLTLQDQYGLSNPLPDSLRTAWAKLAARWAFFEHVLGNLAAAQKIHEESLESFKSASAMKEAGFALSGLGVVTESQGHYEKARGFYEKSFQAYQKTKDRPGTVLSLNRLGHIANLLGQHAKAAAFIKKSLAISQADKDERSMAHSYNLLGDTFHNMGQYEEARIHYQKGLSAYLETGDRRGIAWSFINLGREAEVLGDYAGARQMYQEGMALAKDMGDRGGLAWTNNLLGLLGWAVGDYHEAFQYYQEGLAHYREIGDVRGEAWTLDLMGNLRMAQREDGEAEKFYKQAYGLLLKEGLNDQNLGWNFYHEGTLWAFRNEVKRARDQFLQGLHHFEKTEDSLGQAASLIQLGEMVCRQRDYSESRRYFLTAMRIALQSRLLPFLVDGLIGIAQLLKAEGDDRQAVGFLLVALSHSSCRRQTKDRVVSFSLDWQSHFSKEELEGAIQWARAARIEDVVASWVSSNSRPQAPKNHPPKPKNFRKPRPAKKSSKRKK